nr:unnamed protein product [Digitaria exilis]
MTWVVLESYPARQLLAFTLSSAICLAAGEHPLCTSSSSLVSPPSAAAAASAARRSRYRWQIAQSTATAASAPSRPDFIIFPTTAGMASSAPSHSVARPSAHPAADSSTRSAFADAPARTAAGTAPSRTISARAERRRAVVPPQIAARQESPASTAFPSRVPFSSTGPISRISSATSSDDSATAAAALPSSAALARRNSASLAASTLASMPLPPRITRASDAAEADASAARPAATRFLFASSMPSEATIAASTLVAASTASTLASSSPFLLITDATVSAARPAPTIAFFSKSSTSSSERYAARARSAGEGSVPAAATCRTRLAGEEFRTEESAAAAEAEVGEQVAAEAAQWEMRLRRVRLGTRSVEGSGSMVAGQVVLPESSHRWMEARS